MENITNNINPDHYKKECSLECIESMELIFGEKAVLDFCICNAWKYIWRWKNKNGKEDLSKAHWYVDGAFKYSYHMSTNDEDILNRMKDYLTTMTNAESKEKIYYVVCNDAGRKYGGFDTLEKAIESINTTDFLNNDCSYNHIIKVTKKSEEVYRR